MTDDPKPPQNHAAEQAVLGALLLDPTQAEPLSAELEGRDFWAPTHETIWDAAHALAADPARTLDPVTLAAELTRTGNLQRIGGAPYLHDLMAACATPATAPHYAKLVRDAARLRVVSTVAAKLRQIVDKADPDLVDDAMASSVDALDEAAGRFTTTPRPIVDPFEQRITTWVDDMHVREEAKRRYAAQRAAALDTTPFDAGLLVDVLARPEQPPHRVQGLIPSEAGTLIVAQRKTGKTTLELNLAACLITGDDFLGRFPVIPVSGRIGFLNFEVSAAQLAHWARDANIPSDRLYLVNLRGRRNPLTNDHDRQQLAEQLREHHVEALIVDPFSRAYTGISQNDPGEVGAFLADLDRFARGDVGARDLILSAHAGWNGERSRGSTALEDWADSIVTITRNDAGLRYLRAEGRDVLIDEDQLDYDPVNRTLTLAGAGSRRTAAKIRQLDDLLPAVLDLLRETPSMSGNAIDAALKKQISNGDLDATHSKGDGAKAAQILERRSIVASKDGPRGARLFSIITTSRTSPNLPQGNSGDLPDLPYKGEVAQGSQTTNPPPQAREVTPPTSGDAT